jgi:hypothetical protein
LHTYEGEQARTSVTHDIFLSLFSFVLAQHTWLRCFFYIIHHKYDIIVNVSSVYNAEDASPTVSFSFSFLLTVSTTTLLSLDSSST